MKKPKREITFIFHEPQITPEEKKRREENMLKLLMTVLIRA
jgi:hypothetical protein